MLSLPGLPVHGQVGQAVGLPIPGARDMPDGEGLEPANQGASPPEGTHEVGAPDLVDSADLPHHELRIGKDGHFLETVGEGIVERCNQAGVLGVVVAADSQASGEVRQNLAPPIQDVSPVARGSRISTRSAIDVGHQALQPLSSSYFDTGDASGSQ